jgi:hypothetical protein
LKPLSRWVLDWRTGLTLSLSALIAIVGLVVVDGHRTTQDALAAAREATISQRATAQAATRRIDLLNADLDDVRSELDAVLAATTDAQRRAVVIESNQRRFLPTTTATTATRPSQAPAATTTSTTASKPPVSSTTSTAPPPTTTTAPPRTTTTCVTVSRVGVCR